ncbi:MAG: hypothetical protein EKK48_25680 [Candidatus Melainabacteria bacterium]|nr:MAG: hypothetical protein EKK48_25680 [Candidatus Melainabacteria bacterium]
MTSGPNSEPLKFDVTQIGDDSLRSHLMTAQELHLTGRTRQAEERYRQALQLAETHYGPQHFYYMQVLIAVTEFYEAVGAMEEIRKLGNKRNETQSGLEKKLLKTKDDTDEPVKTVKAPLPTEIRKAAQILGVPFDDLTPATVHKAWRSQMALQTVHPDLGGEAEAAVLVNKAKAQLDAWFEERSPKLGKKLKPGDKPGDKK